MSIKRINQSTKNLLMKAYEAGFYAGQQCEFKALRNDYANMQTTRKKYIDSKFTVDMNAIGWQECWDNEVEPRIKLIQKLTKKSG